MVTQQFEKHPAAEQLEADLHLFSHRQDEERLRACHRLSEAGSSAVKPLLQRAVYDVSREVRAEAMWALVRMGDDWQAVTDHDGDIDELLQETERSIVPFIQCCAAVLRGRQDAITAAQTAYERLSLFSDDTNEASLSLLERLIREDIHEPGLDEVLDLAGRHRLLYVRCRTDELKALLTERRDVRVGSPGPAALLNGTLKQRRTLVLELPVIDLTAAQFFHAAVGDPDRRVRYQATARLFAYLKGDKSAHVTFGTTVPDGETSEAFSLGEGEVKSNPAAVASFRATFEIGDSRAKRRLLELIAHLRPLADEPQAAELDSLMSLGMRDKDREVRGRYGGGQARRNGRVVEWADCATTKPVGVRVDPVLHVVVRYPGCRRCWGAPTHPEGDILDAGSDAYRHRIAPLPQSKETPGSPADRGRGAARDTLRSRAGGG